MEQLAVDIGGTFVDAVRFDREAKAVTLGKSSTTPATPIDGVMAALEKLEPDLGATDSFVHGTTLGVNAILEREGATTGIITNEGFVDVFEVGRYDRPHDEMFNPLYARPDPLVPRARRLGVPGRLDAEGNELEPIDREAVMEAAETLVEGYDCGAIAVCLLHSYQNPRHERAIGEVIRERHPSVSVSLSSDLTREYREYERTSTTVMDAYIKPIFDSYVAELDGRLADEGFSGSFFLTRSGGGALAAESATEMPVNTILSGPAGGIIGAAHVAESTGFDDLIAADIGGTSTDACVIRDGDPIIEHESAIGHYPMLIPAYDIRTIGSGGGSIAWLDGGLLKVGPKSAGADPGPICYGQGGTEPTVTDAAVLLGYIDPDAFLGGEMALDVDAAEAGVRERLAEPLDLSVRDACRGVFDVMAADIVNAIREITVERGLDPREFGVLAYGGAGPLIMPIVAREMAVEGLVVPPAPSVFSAWGMLLSDVVYDVSRTRIADLRETSLEAVEEGFAALEERGGDQLSGEGFGPGARSLTRSAEMRYTGQEHTVSVPADGVDSLADLEDRFHARHEQRYGHRMDDPVELVHLRVRAVGETDKPELGRVDDVAGASRDDDAAVAGEREAFCVAERAQVPFDVYDRRALPVGEPVQGPAIVEESTSTIGVFSDQVATVDDLGNLRIRGAEP